MTKKRVTTTLFIALVVLTLISCCFLGSTFARYVSEGNGAASVTVADWAVDFGVQGSDVGGTTTVTFKDLSPDMSTYEEAAGSPRTHGSAFTHLATIKNTGDVAAKITLTRGAAAITKVGNAPTPDDAPDYYDDTTLAALFELELYVSDTELSAEDAEALAEALWDGNETYKLPATTGTLYIYGVANWNTDDTDSAEDEGAAADEKDTYAGMYVESVNWSLGYKAEQASELPKT